MSCCHLKPASANEGPRPHPLLMQVLVWKDDAHARASAFAPDRSLEGHAEDILSIAFLQPNLLATSGYDGMVNQE